MLQPKEVTLQSRYVNKHGGEVNNLVESHVNKDGGWPSLADSVLPIINFNLWYVNK
jgi:hypothetical protein